MRSKRNGFAAVYGLLVLLLVTVCGTALLFLTRKSRESIADYSAYEVSAMAANAALKAVEKELLSSACTTVAKLTKYNGDTSYKYLLKGAATNMNVDTTIAFDGNVKYSARILKFNQANSLLLVEGAGYDGLGGKKKMTALYKLDGLFNGTPAYPSVGGLKFGLYLVSGIENGNAPMTVKGSFYLGKPTNNGNKFNGGAKVHIYGDFKTYIGTDVISIDSFVVHQDAYLQNSNFSPSNKLKVLGTTSYAQVSNPAPDTLRLPAAAWSSAQAVNSNFSAANLESWWTTKKNNGTLFNGWLVLNVTGSVNIDTTGGPFKRKVMILDSSASNNIGLQQDSWYNCADTSNTLIYVKSTSWATLLFKLAANKKFRGYIYVNTTGTNTQFQFGTGSVFNGAMCFRKGGFDINSPGAFTLDYSDGSIGQAAVQELIDMSVLFPAN